MERFRFTGCVGSGGTKIRTFSYVFQLVAISAEWSESRVYSNPKVDALIDQARREVDPAVRKPIYAEVQRILAEELPYIDLVVSR